MYERVELILGWFLGLTGVVPFVHTNLLLSLAEYTPSFAASLAFSHLVFELFPLIFFGIPAAAYGISCLPAQQLAQEGQSVKAFFLAASGLCAGVFFAVLLSPFFITFWPIVFPLIKPYSGILLIGLVMAAWWADQRPKHAPFVFVGSGLLGLAVFRLPMPDPLFPLLSGLFGIPAILMAGNWIEAKKGSLAPWKLRHAFLGSVLGGFSVLLPALSPSFLASLAFWFYSHSAETFLVLSSAIASSKVFFDFLAAAVLHKARSASAAVWLENRVQISDTPSLLLLGIISFILAMAVALAARPIFCRLFKRTLSAPLFIGLISLSVWLISDLLGLFVLAWSAAWSCACLVLKTPRKYLVGALMAPSILYSLGLF